MSFQTRQLGVEFGQGEDFVCILTISDANGPIDLTGYHFLGEMKPDTDPATLVAAEFVFAILNQTTNKGQVKWSLPASVTAAIPVSVAGAETKKRLTTPYAFDVKMKDVAGTISRIVEGVVYVSPEVTLEAFL